MNIISATFIFIKKRYLDSSSRLYIIQRKLNPILDEETKEEESILINEDFIYLSNYSLTITKLKLLLGN